MPGKGLSSREHSECKGSEGTCLVGSKSSEETGVLEHGEWGWEGQAVGKLRLREGEKTGPAKRCQ